MKIFISWSGRRSRQIADALTKWLKEVFSFHTPPLDVFVSTQDIRAGAKWSEIINAALRDSSFGVLCLTPENLNAPWILFEGGALSKTAGEMSVCPYLYDLEFTDLKRPLEQFNGVKADEAGTKKLVFDINNLLGDKKIYSDLFEPFFKDRWPKLDAELKKVPSVNSDVSLSLSRLQQELPITLSIVKDRKWFSENIYFSQVVLDSVQQFKNLLEETGPYFDVPETLYPIYLVNLLKKHNPVVKAIAKVGDIEEFWPQKEGEEIRKATNKDSTRIFVFRKREHLQANLDTLLRHAGNYNVYALNHDRLAAEFPDYVQDFSIIGGTSAPLLAYYVESSTRERGALPMKMIRFSASPSELSRHDEAFNAILGISTRVDKGLDISDETQIERLLDKVFMPEFREFGKKQVEMSSYLEVDLYDAHEEEHAYFKDMMGEMIALLKKYRKDGDSRARVLELGAGTGIFTKRLAEVGNLDITALEIDWACFHLLKKNLAAYREVMLKNNTSLVTENKDSRRYNPSDKFDFVFSSFSDHHIYFADKEKYLRNIARNLKDGGIVIVGDEFLRDHDEKDANARKEALEAYHQHIIAIAKEQKFPALVKLEEIALESGLRGWGDFKTSCEHYKSLVEGAGFKIIHEQKVGPPDIDNIGGVYVYAFTKD